MIISSKMNFSTERENNIIKNVAKEIVMECEQNGFEVTQELADCMVKLKLLNPKNGFTASEVMPRSLTQQLVTLVVEELKQDTPAMNCIRMQVYWESVKMNVADLKREYFALTAERAEPYLLEILALEREESSKMIRILASYVLLYFNLGNPVHVMNLKETLAAIHSIFKYREPSVYQTYHNLPNEQKAEKIKCLAKTVTGVRLYLKHLGKAGENIQQVNDLPDKIETLKKDISAYNATLTSKIEDIREVISNVFPIDNFMVDITDIPIYPENMPQDCDENDLRYLKKLLAIMLQHRIYLSDISSKLDEIDGDANFFLEEFYDTLLRLQGTIRNRDAVPTTEVYDEFLKAGEIWSEIQSYIYCLECVKTIKDNLEATNKKEYFTPTTLEKSFTLKVRTLEKEPKFPSLSIATFAVGSNHSLKEPEDFHVEFSGYCAWTLYYSEGTLVPGNADLGLFQFQDQYFCFSSKAAKELWAKDPHFCLMEIYEYLRNNPELVFLLNVYDNLYNIKSVEFIKKVDRKTAARKETTQTDLHPVEEYWDKDYTFNLWELRKRALSLSRIVKCATKSVQTVSPHSHNRNSIGLLAAPDKDKQVQTKKDSSCNHSTIANYLYGLRGHREDKFRVVDLTRPIDETFERQITLEERDLCRDRKKKFGKQAFWHPPCPSPVSESLCDVDYDDLYSEYLNKYELLGRKGSYV